MKVFCIFDCDEWKSRQSMSLLCVCDAEHLEDMLHDIKEDHEFTDEDMETYIYIEELTLNEVC